MLSEDDETYIKSLDFEAVIFGENIKNSSEIEYLLLHSKLSDELLLKCRTVSIMGLEPVIPIM